MQRWGVMLSLLAACSGEPGSVDRAGLALAAFCEAEVDGVGLIDVETDYLPHVVSCENGAADFEALRAQAVAARSYLYYRLERTGSIGDGTGDQVYTCSRPPTDDHYRAVEESSGLVLQYMGTQVAAFYVAGAKQTPPDCVGGTDDPTNTERYVTYNEGLSGADIEQTSLGFVDPSNFANRGCMSQNGSHCLAEAGEQLDRILRFYYGEDIELVRADGPCVIGGDAPDAGPGIDPGGPGGDGGGATSGGCRAARGASPVAALLALTWLAASRSRRPRRRPAGARAA